MKALAILLLAFLGTSACSGKDCAKDRCKSADSREELLAERRAARSAKGRDRLRAEVPDIDVVLTPVYSGLSSTGAMGLGEPATVPTAAAIANAVRHAIGVPIRELPMTPERVLRALGRG